jgi:site-specific recombinase XerD
MAAEKKYYEQMNIDIELKIRDILKDLPPFCKEYFIGMESSTQARTRLAYAYDLGVFFNFLHENNPVCQKMEIREFPLSLLEQITPMDIEEYLYSIRYYQKDGTDHTNDERGVSRKLASLRSFYNYFFRKTLIEKNPAELVKMPKVHEKNIIRLDVDEVAKFLDEVDSGEDLSDRQKRFHEQTRTRDLAMMTLLLGTGIRVSECVGLDIEDVDLNNDGIKVHRKGGAETVVYFGDEVREALLPYLEERETIEAREGSTNALFLSLQKKRISVRTVELMVKKYAALVTSLKKITPHKLRSTYGTSLYRETGDIYLVADVLGHKDVNTTRKHYAAQEEDRRRAAAKYVHLRKD